MPKIAELKEIDGHLWARVELLEPQPVHMLTDDEVHAIRKDERMACVDVLQQARKGEIDGDLRSIIARITSL